MRDRKSSTGMFTDPEMFPASYSCRVRTSNRNGRSATGLAIIVSVSLSRRGGKLYAAQARSAAFFVLTVIGDAQSEVPVVCGFRADQAHAAVLAGIPAVQSALKSAVG